jgi:3',5'-nucleoside bisphosphate phosphatase
LAAKVELHAHTTASDGTLSPTELVELALDNGLSLLAVTDHDSTDGVSEAMARAAGTPLEVWPGVEISTDVPNTEVHILGYFVDPTDAEFAETLARLRDSRVWRAQQMVEKLGALGMEVSFERVREIAGTGAIGRPHVAQALVEAGHVRTAKDAFDLYLHRNGPAYADRFKLTPAEAIQLIRRAGGMAVLAHPTYINPGDTAGFDLTTFVRELIDVGLLGMECYYGDYSPETKRNLSRIARQLGLIPTGGSDFHGGNTPASDLGGLDVPAETIEKMREWRKNTEHRTQKSGGDRGSSDL